MFDSEKTSLLRTQLASQQTGVIRIIIRYILQPLLGLGDLIQHAGEALGFFIFLITTYLKNDLSLIGLRVLIGFLHFAAFLVAVPDFRTCWRMLQASNRKKDGLLPPRHAQARAGEVGKVDKWTSIAVPVKEMCTAPNIWMTIAVCLETFHCGFGEETDFGVSLGALLLALLCALPAFVSSLICHFYLSARSDQFDFVPLDEPEHTNKWALAGSFLKELICAIKTFVGAATVLGIYGDYQADTDFGISSQVAPWAACIAFYATISSVLFHVQLNYVHQKPREISTSTQLSFFGKHLASYQRMIRAGDHCGHAVEVMDAGLYLLFLGVKSLLPDGAFITLVLIILGASFALSWSDSTTCHNTLTEIQREEAGLNNIQRQDYDDRGSLMTI